MFENPKDTSLSDEYDRQTVEECRLLDKYLQEKDNDSTTPIHIRDSIRKLALYFKKGERYHNKEDVISRQTTFIKERKIKLDEAKPTTNALCLLCQKPMDLFDKDYHGYGKEERILFHFRCNKCNTHRLFFNNGEEYRPTPHKCSKCNSGNIKKNHNRELNIITSTYTCLKCNHIDTEVFDLDENYNEVINDPDYLKDRDKYCLSEKEGQEFRSFISSMEYFNKHLEDKNHTETKEQFLDYNI